MQKRYIIGIPLQVYSDEIMKLSYVKFLTHESLENIKLPTYLRAYKYQYMINPNFVLECEIIKTTKNWVLTNIISYKNICNLKNYNDYLKFSQMIHKINENIKENQATDALQFIIQFFLNQDFSTLDVQTFEKNLYKNLGFA